MSNCGSNQCHNGRSRENIDEYSPRIMPPPTPTSSVNVPKPSVPEVSLLCNEAVTVPPQLSTRTRIQYNRQSPLHPRDNDIMPGFFMPKIPLHGNRSYTNSQPTIKTPLYLERDYETPIRNGKDYYSGSDDKIHESTCCKEVHVLLHEQSEQIQTLQRQLEKILQTQTCLSNSNVSVTVDGATQTTPITSPLKNKSDTSPCDEHLHCELDENNEFSINMRSLHVPTIHEQLMSPPSSIHVNLQDLQDSLDSSDSPGVCGINVESNPCMSWDSPELGEIASVNSNQQQRNYECYQNDRRSFQQQCEPRRWEICNNAACANEVNQMQHEEHLKPPPCNQHAHGDNAVQQRTTEYIKTLGVSFIDQRQEVVVRDTFNSIYVPKLEYMPYYPDSSESYGSMEFNTLAVKYGKENTTTANGYKSPNDPARSEGMVQQVYMRKSVQNEQLGPSEVTLYGMSSSNLSFATRQYLQKYGLTADGYQQPNLHSDRGYHQHQNRHFTQQDERLVQQNERFRHQNESFRPQNEPFQNRNMQFFQENDHVRQQNDLFLQQNEQYQSLRNYTEELQLQQIQKRQFNKSNKENHRLPQNQCSGNTEARERIIPCDVVASDFLRGDDIPKSHKASCVCSNCRYSNSKKSSLILGQAMLTGLNEITRDTVDEQLFSTNRILDMDGLM